MSYIKHPHHRGFSIKVVMVTAGESLQAELFLGFTANFLITWVGIEHALFSQFLLALVLSGLITWHLLLYGDFRLLSLAFFRNLKSPLVSALFLGLTGCCAAQAFIPHLSSVAWPVLAQ